MSSAQLVKIHFTLDRNDWHGHRGESLWAKPVAGSRYELQNSPFFATGVSYLDIVECHQADDTLEFAKVVSRGGHSTFMVLVPPDTTSFATWWTRLAALGCTYESNRITLSIGERILYSVDVPGADRTLSASRILAEGEAAGVWLFQNGYVHS